MAFRTGNIVKIYMKNFLTYNEIEIFPQPHLNVIIGPNGTGKSSVICALCLSLGGVPELTGRGKQIWEYIKHGKEEAEIEVELYHNSGNIIIKRCFEKKSNSSASRWFYNGQQVTNQRIKEIVEIDMGIQVNNLCQFLPQDRVIEFARMDKVQLLHSTEKAVGEMELAKQHEVLCDSGSKMLEQQNTLAALETRLSSEIATNNKLKEQVQNIKHKENLENAIKDLKKYIFFNKYDESFKEFKIVNNELKKLKSKMAELKRKTEPNDKKKMEVAKDLESHHNILRKETSDARKLQAESVALKLKWEHEKESIGLAKHDFKAAQENHQRMVNDLTDHRRQLLVMKGQFEELGEVDESVFNERLKNVNLNITSKSSQFTNIQSSLEVIENEMRVMQLAKKNMELELLRIQDVKRQRLQLLIQSQSHNRNVARKNENIYTAAVWLESNHHLFKGNVWGPLFTEIELENSCFSMYLENAIRKEDLIAFVCEEKEDVNLLKYHADCQKWIINVLHSPPVDPNSYKPILSNEAVRKLGFSCYLKDMIKAPPAVVSYLCRNYRLESLPVDPNDNVKLEYVPDTFVVFYVGKSRYTKKRSLYDRELTTTVSAIGNAYFLSKSQSQKRDDIEKMQAQIKDIIAREGELLNSSNDKKTLLTGVDKELEGLRREKKCIQVEKGQGKQLEKNILDKEETIKRKEVGLVDLADAEKTMNSAIEKVVGDLFNLIRSGCALEAKISSICKNSIENGFMVVELGRKLYLINQEMKEIMEEQNLLKEKCSTLDEQVMTKKEDARVQLNSLYQSLGLPNGSNISDEVIRNLNQNSEEGLESLERKLAEKEATRDCLITADEGILEEFSKREEEIELMRKNADDLQNNISNSKDYVDKCHKKWLPHITKLTQNINQRFQAFMAQLDFSGEVQLDKGVNEDDFSKYGLAIRVKFRNSEKLKDLTAHEQSGGERSVSTALYLMALQTLSAVPFRCVDEINQGMDPKNERKMFTLLVKSTTTETASQYFLVTPKLLPNLPFNDRVNFLTVFNSDRLVLPKSLNSDLLTRLKQRKLSRKQ